MPEPDRCSICGEPITSDKRVSDAHAFCWHIDYKMRNLDWFKRQVDDQVRYIKKRYGDVDVKEMLTKPEAIKRVIGQRIVDVDVRAGYDNVHITLENGSVIECYGQSLTDTAQVEIDGVQLCEPRTDADGERL